MMESFDPIPDPWLMWRWIMATQYGFGEGDPKRWEFKKYNGMQEALNGWLLFAKLNQKTKPKEG